MRSTFQRYTTRRGATVECLLTSSPRQSFTCTTKKKSSHPQTAGTQWMINIPTASTALRQCQTRTDTPVPGSLQTAETGFREPILSCSAAPLANVSRIGSARVTNETGVRGWDGAPGFRSDNFTRTPKSGSDNSPSAWRPISEPWFLAWGCCVHHWQSSRCCFWQLGDAPRWNRIGRQFERCCHGAVTVL